MWVASTRLEAPGVSQQGDEIPTDVGPERDALVFSNAITNLYIATRVK